MPLFDPDDPLPPVVKGLLSALAIYAATVAVIVIIFKVGPL